MGKKIISTIDYSIMTDIADAINTKHTERSPKGISPVEMAAEIMSIPTSGGGGVDTSDATALRSEIFEGKTAYISTGRTTGTFTLNKELQDQTTVINNIREALKGKGAGGGGGNGSEKLEVEKTVSISQNGRQEIVPDNPSSQTLSKVILNINVPNQGGGTSSNYNREVSKITSPSLKPNFKTNTGTIEVWGYGTYGSGWRASDYVFLGNSYQDIGYGSSSGISPSLNANGDIIGLPSMDSWTLFIARKDA